MKNLARLALFFSVSFVLLFLFAVLFRFLALWIDAARIMPVRTEYSADFFSALTWAVPAALYAAILLCLSYTARGEMSIPLSILGIAVLCGAFTLGLSFGIRQIEGMNFTVEAAPSLRNQAGLMLSRTDTAMILLSGDVRGPRVVSFSDQPLIYQEAPRGPNDTVLTLPALPFRSETPWLIQSILIDFTLSARHLDALFREGLFSFCIYAFSLIFLLASLRFLLDLSVWPLANLFLGAVVFRGILALETFLNTRETAYFISSFLKNTPLMMLSDAFINPLIFSGLGFLVILYTLLAHLAKGKGHNEA
jgi:hypothetical protein